MEKSKLVLAVDTRTSIRNYNNSNPDEEKMTASLLAEKVGITRVSISNWSPSRETPQVPAVVYKLHKIAKVLGCTIDDLIVECNG